MGNNFNLNILHSDDPDRIEKIANNRNHYFTLWIAEYKKGIKTKEEVLQVAEKVANFMNDDSFVEKIKSRMGLL